MYDVDAGGLPREFYQSIGKEMFNANYALFKQSADNYSVFQPNATSHYNYNHLKYFKFVGMIVAKQYLIIKISTQVW